MFLSVVQNFTWYVHIILSDATDYKKQCLRLSSELPGLVVFLTSSTDINLEKYKVYWQDAFRFEYDKAGLSRIIVLISTINCPGKCWSRDCNIFFRNGYFLAGFP
ncbi:hypothetical protein L2E82_09046 [Cichorium intybus]|uniref:Uncharacterized protein n=1 Tax=Cichorium intybus TaxID=13427 RepID=A0ACB9G8E7_CICIN|nr:hypothetical protein L2E82_09046 [Cichorium intybus]